MTFSDPTRILWSARRRLRRAVESTWDTIRGNRVGAYWAAYPNFGDLITPLALRRYGFTPAHQESAETAEIVSTGSLLQWVPTDYDGIILGTGLIHDEARVFPRATILAVRGQLTAERIGATPNVVLADPGLLAARLLGPPPRKKHLIGLVPHYVDVEQPVVHALLRAHPREIAFVDVRREPLEVFQQIAECECILSSSLHGIITADSMGIPNAWLALSDKLLGGAFKFRDYFSSLGVTVDPVVLRGDERPQELIRLTRQSPASVAERTAEVHALFSSLADYLQR